MKTEAVTMPQWDTLNDKNTPQHVEDSRTCSGYFWGSGDAQRTTLTQVYIAAKPAGNYTYLVE